MALTEAAWKKVLDQPKNLGLKAVGSGISKCLREVEGAKRTFDGSKTLDAFEKGSVPLVASLKDLQTQIDLVVRKHSKLFTTACAYLTTIKAEAAKAITDTAAKVEAEKRAAEREQKFEERVKEGGDEHGTMDKVAKTHAAHFGKLHDLEGLHKAMDDFIKAFGPLHAKYAMNVAIHDPNLQIAYQQIEMLARDKKGDFAKVHADLIVRSDRLLHALANPPKTQPYKRPF